MNRTKRIFVLVLALVMCFLTACGGNDTTTEPTTDNNANNVTPEASPLTLFANDASDYQIVYPAKNNGWERGVSIRLQNTILAVTGGFRIPVVKDTDAPVDANAKEIIIATPDYNRDSAYTAKGGAEKGYNIFVEGNRLIIEAGSKTGAIFAISQFCKDHFGFDMEAGDMASRIEGLTAINVSAQYAASRTIKSAEFPYIGIPAADFQVSYHGDSYVQKCVAVTLCAEMRTILGYEIWPWDRAYGTEEGQRYISIEQDDTIEKGDWEIRPSEDGIAIVSNGYHGFEDAIERFIKAKTSDGYYNLKVGDVIGGNYFENLNLNKEVDKTNSYVYNKLANNRVMFYNVLWGNSYKNDDGSVINYPANERNQLQLEMFAEYMPDVLGLQEFNDSKRFGMYGIKAGLEELGYVEAVDYIVDNASREEYWLGGAVKDENGKLLGYKPGKGKPVGQAVDADKYGFSHTYTNNTPLFYNTKTTKLIAAEYYWYKNQWDLGELVTDEYGTYYPTNHENGASDCASKALTWGVFENIATGERYIAISTHMCTRSDKIRGLQAQEVVELVAQLVAQYDCPVFFGGDMNGHKGSSNYELFISEEVGFKSMQDHEVASVYNSQMMASHAYPDHQNGILTTGGSIGLIPYKGASIDHIFAINHDNADIKVFSVVIDMCSLRGADHFPIFTDFNINPESTEE